MDMDTFTEIVWQRGRELYRDMPWRTDTQPYYVLVSELMLQQTQVSRVIPKFEAFITAFPDTISLAQADLSEVLVLWQGLGYNRRAKYLHESAKLIVSEFDNQFPQTRAELLRLPGVGPGTAGALMTYAFNQFVPFIETNVRTVYFHHFFTDGDKVSDAELLPLVEQSIDRDSPREFYWALMDYGSWLKRQGGGRIAQSKHYVKQSPLKGSVREVRGQIIAQLVASRVPFVELRDFASQDARFAPALDGLLRDGLVVQVDDRLYLTK